jgi:hypothetical protein
VTGAGAWAVGVGVTGPPAEGRGGLALCEGF